jgi:tetratricopeptide (TPR) repeat protein
MADRDDIKGAPDLAERVETALQSLWRGDGDTFQALIAEESAGELDLGGVLTEAWQGSTTAAGCAAQVVIPGYEILERIGRGGMGVVYKAVQCSTKRVVAVKILLGGALASAQARRRFQREIELAAGLQHDGIARVLASGMTADDQPYYAMDYVEGSELRAWAENHRAERSRVIELFLELCNAVSFAHTHGVLHRDLKPANILVTADEHAKVLDFGLARLLDPEQTTTWPGHSGGHIVGTLRYTSPDQLRADGQPPDVRSDVYSLGVILYELLTGQLPYDLSSCVPAALRTICEQTPVRPRTLDRTLPGDLEVVVLKALEKRPDRRYPTVQAFADDVRHCLRREPIQARRPSGWYFLRRQARRYRGRIALLILVILMLALARGWWLSRQAPAYNRTVARRKCTEMRCRLDGPQPRAHRTAAENLFQFYPDLPEARLLNRLAMVDDTPHNAIALLKDDVEDTPECWWCRVTLADMYELSEQPEAAAAQRSLVQELAPDTAEAWYMRSFAAIEPTQAQHCARQAVERDPEHVLAWIRLAYTSRALGDYGQARLAAKRLSRLDVAERRRWLVFQTELAMAERNWSTALACSADVMQENPQFAAGYRLRGHILRRLGEYEEAETQYTNAIAHADATNVNPWLYFHRATVRWILGKRSAAAGDCRRTRELLMHPSFADARLYLILHELGRPDEAEVLLQEILGAEGSPAPGTWLATVMRCLAGELSITDLAARGTGAGRTSESACEAYYYAGERCLLEGRPAAAMKWFERCLATNVTRDLDTVADPMTEYELAAWRRLQLSADHVETPSSNRKNP